MAKEDREKTRKAEARARSAGKAVEDGASAGQGGAMPGIRELLDMDQAIKLLNTSRPTFYRWLRGGQIKGVKLGRQWRFYREDVERFLKGQGPRVELPADIKPLIKTLQERLEGLGVKGAFGPPDDVTGAVSRMIRLGFAMRASDLHLAPLLTRPGENSVAVLQYRVDGVLNVIAEFDLRLLPAIIEKWKTLAACNVQENKKPQDGRILLNLTDMNKPLDLRVCFMPAVMGEALTARFLDRSAVVLSLDRFDYPAREMETIQRWLRAPSGIIIVSGPTGSGKTTTLYACLNQVANSKNKVISIEDPVEFLLPWVVQTQLNAAAGVTFARALRSALRSDPDVVLVGEIRDRETLEITQQVALTGHLVLTTLHTEDAPSALKRMVDIGTDPFIIADSTRLIIAQRLVRCLCPECSMEQSPPAAHLEQAAELARTGGLDWNSLPKKFREAVGCPKCNKFGFKGRKAIIEVLEVTPEIGAALRRGASVDEMRAIAVGQGMTTLVADGIRRAAAGTTTLEEVLHVVGIK
jgi:excisionase family DNA binding protein